MGFMKRAMSLPVSRASFVEKELVKHHYPMSWKLAKKEADKTREILGPGASPEEVLRVTNERLEASPSEEEPVPEEREMETEKEEEVNTPTPEPVEEERELAAVEEQKEEEEEEEEMLPGLTCGDIHITGSELKAVVPPLEPEEEKGELETERGVEMDTPTPEPVEQERGLETKEEGTKEEETGIPGLSWGDINLAKAIMEKKLKALMNCW